MRTDRGPTFVRLGRPGGFRRLARIAPAALGAVLVACALSIPGPQQDRYDIVIRNGVVYDGSGADGARTDVGIRGDRIAAVADLSAAAADQVVDAGGLAVSPGFINLLSWAPDSLLVDGRGMADTKQGVTLEVFGEGWSMGPLNPAMKAEMLAQQGDIKFPITWTTLGEYLDHLVELGITPNVASFVGAATVRIHELGYANRAPNPEELERMKNLVRAAMRDGALGVGSALIYPPGFFAKTDELIALTQAAGESGGGYISHMRSEGNRLMEALEELITITRTAGVHGEVYHMKAAGKDNWPKMRQMIDRIEKERAAGLDIAGNMYAYTAGATGLDAAMPPWVQEGGLDKWIERLKDPKIRKRVIREMRRPTNEWENLLLAVGSPEKALLIQFKEEKLKPLTGKTLAEVARMRRKSPEDTAIDLVIEDHTRVGTAYFLMSEDNVKLGLSQPWVALGSDAGSPATEGVFLKSNEHPRAYGNFARFLGKYVREERVTTLADAIRRMTQRPAHDFKLVDRGCLKPGCFADVAIFDPATITDHATFDQPHQYATGMRDVFVNGVQVLNDGAHTGAKPGRVVRGPGWVNK
jgi:N-acyl-D-amino-acid deacylase